MGCHRPFPVNPRTQVFGVAVWIDCTRPDGNWELPFRVDLTGSPDHRRTARSLRLPSPTVSASNDRNPPSRNFRGRDPQRLLYVCAVTRRCFPVGASPTRRTLQPEATGAVMEVTKWLKPLV